MNLSLVPSTMYMTAHISRRELSPTENRLGLIGKPRGLIYHLKVKYVCMAHLEFSVLPRIRCCIVTMGHTNPFSTPDCKCEHCSNIAVLTQQGKQWRVSCQQSISPTSSIQTTCTLTSIWQSDTSTWAKPKRSCCGSRTGLNSCRHCRSAAWWAATNGLPSYHRP